ncbi:MAG: (Fe-S)-binding protein [Deltaproteobacteria bacterium]|nr:(Fe-S)-binding protein [Deltaproteobacteria bacterium]
MYTLKHDEAVCAACPSPDCLLKCQYMDLDKDQAHEEMMKVVRGEDSLVLQQCMTCYACEEYCKRGNHPYYLICERREEKDILTAARPITNQWINLTTMQGKFMTGAVQDTAMSCCFIPDLGGLGSGKLFEEINPAFVLGAEFMCPAVHTHFARMSVIKERLPQVLDNFKKLGVSRVICLHDECYGTYTSIAPAYGMEVPFEPIHYMDYLVERLEALKKDLSPLNTTAVYQRPCSNRLIPEKYPLVAEIMDRIGVEIKEREYHVSGYRLADDIQKKNIDDMAATDAEYCVFNCPFCQTTLSKKVTKAGLKPIHMIDLCKMAIGEK